MNKMDEQEFERKMRAAANQSVDNARRYALTNAIKSAYAAGLTELKVKSIVDGSNPVAAVSLLSAAIAAKEAEGDKPAPKKKVKVKAKAKTKTSKLAKVAAKKKAAPAPVDDDEDEDDDDDDDDTDAEKAVLATLNAGLPLDDARAFTSVAHLKVQHAKGHLATWNPSLDAMNEADRIAATMGYRDASHLRSEQKKAKKKAGVQ